MRFQLQLSSVLFSLGLAAGCTNGQFGGQVGADGDGGTNSEGGTCEVKSKKKMGVDETTALGFTGAQVIALAQGSHAASLTWASNQTSVELVPAAGKSTITFDVKADEGTLELMDLEPKEGAGGMENALSEDEPCKDELRFTANVHVKSDNGAFDDDFEAVFRASAARLVETSIELSPGKLEGSFDVTVVTPENAQSIQNRLELGFLPGSVSGTISGMVEASDGASVSATGLEFGHFPVESCEHGYLIPADSDWGKELVALVDAPIDFDLSWQNGDKTSLALDSEVSRICYLDGAWSDVETVALVLASRAKSADGRVDGTWDLSANIELDSAGAPTSVHVFRDAYLASTFATDVFQQETGISGFVFGVGKVATFQFGYDVDWVAELTSGVLTIFEGTPADCGKQEVSPDDGGASTPGCAGTDYAEIEQATLRAAD